MYSHDELNTATHQAQSAATIAAQLGIVPVTDEVDGTHANLMEFAQACANWDPDAYPEPQGNAPVIEPERDAQGIIID